MEALPRHLGHFLNWYDNLTLTPLEPRFVSSVDSGNLAASLWSLKHHCLELHRSANPKKNLIGGLADHYRLAGLKIPKPLSLEELLASAVAAKAGGSPEQEYWLAQTNTRLAAIRDELTATATTLADLSSRLLQIANQCDRLVREMNFEVLLDKRRRLLSVGYDVTKQELAKSCYDLLASEARTAAFISVATAQAPQETWFRLGRQHTVCEGQTALISWTGTMFEYLMPVIWMRSYPNTLLDRTMRATVRAHRSYATARRVPWGISEAAYSKTDELGNYQYAAFGVPGLALNVARAGSLVISPYSSCLALLVDPATAVANLHRMARWKWLAQYGFYESADFTPFGSRGLMPRKYKLVRCWMSHHQGMTLAAICNLFNNSAFQRWFHAEPVVQASDLDLQERPLRATPVVDTQPKRVLGLARLIPKQD
jgi:hypothetical protein